MGVNGKPHDNDGFGAVTQLESAYKGFASRDSKFAIRSRRVCSPNLFDQLPQILKHFVFFFRARSPELAGYLPR
jgi:hypothetical protein